MAACCRPMKKVLIANRGEIAVRVMRSCREMGLATVAVYSDVDRGALHVTYADEAYRLGPGPATESYLRGDLILEVAKRSGADAIHPGYGFLSENAAFAEACETAGITFVGPPASAMRALGSKTKARQAADAAQMPRVPGSVTGLATVQEAIAVAEQIGYPVMLKAAAGGGGKGMRAVTAAADLPAAYSTASSEAERSFGSGEVYLEKLIERPRHIEIQIMADMHGNCLYLGERECSVQRRHQKVIEEAPSAVVEEDLRRRMGEAAVRLALSAGYVNAGTVEFLVDADQNFYFLEMNTRLQVEHPVTEQITGLDLVKLQLRIAEGEKLPFKQEDLKITGHAIEVRVYAEDPANNFLPDIGTLSTYRRPQGHGIRVDDGFEQGMSIPFYYDPMIAKMTCHAENREQAIAKTIRAIDEYEITGVQTTLGFCKYVLTHEAFTSGNFDTRFVEKYFKPEVLSPQPSDDEAMIAAALAVVASQKEVQKSNRANGASTTPAVSKWKTNRTK